MYTSYTGRLRLRPRGIIEHGAHMGEQGYAYGGFLYVLQTTNETTLASQLKQQVPSTIHQQSDPAWL